MTIKKVFTVTLLFLVFGGVFAQTTVNKEVYEQKKEAIIQEEKEALKKMLEDINARFDRGEITQEEVTQLKEEAAKKHALNIEDRILILDSQIAIHTRNEEEKEEKEDFNEWVYEEDDNLYIRISNIGCCDKVVYDRRTYLDVVMAAGFNNTIIDGESFNDTPYKIGGSRFFDIGLAWRTRVFKHSNWLRLNYGFSFQFNGLKPDDNKYFVDNDGQIELEEFEYDLDKAKLRMDNLVFPVYFEIGPSKYREYDNRIRYSTYRRFRLGLGGYAGFNLSTMQKLKYNKDGDNVKDKRENSYQVNSFVYGLSGYMGWGDVQLYVKYDLNPLFKNQTVEQRNIGVGLRWSL
ncbi:porin family protein [Sediminicola luteus]|uniref:Outer membrane protein beta-barrel domain-containing protein n=1 Tax=Sediminicola luteus TaxID=319238 RepID=A0A2A4G5V6_9FLAO|nr:hypothetical protein [Sediminicola luteus]PCE63368.1 hypothetical protein B7P33_14210 [Sediminicola luteus]